MRQFYANNDRLITSSKVTMTALLLNYSIIREATCDAFLCLVDLNSIDNRMEIQRLCRSFIIEEIRQLISYRCMSL